MAESHREEIAKLEALYAGNPGGRVFVHLAEAYRKAGEHERARRILDDGLARHTDSASGYVVLGRVLADMQIGAEAEAAFRRVLELDGGNLVALRWLGDLARQDGRQAEAAAHYRELLTRNPSNEEVRDLVEIIERETDAVRAGAARQDGLTEDLDEILQPETRAEPAVAEPVSEVERPAVSEPPQAGVSVEGDVSPWSVAPGMTGPVDESPVEYGLVEIAGVQPEEVEEAPSYGPTFPSEEGEVDLVASIDDDTALLELDGFSRDDEADPVEIHLLDPAFEASQVEEGAEADLVTELDLSDLAAASSFVENEGEYAGADFIADLATAGEEEQAEDTLPAGFDVMGGTAAFTLLDEDAELVHAAPEAGTERPGETERLEEAERADEEPPLDVSLSSAAAGLSDLAGAAQPAAEAASGPAAPREAPADTGLVTETMALLYRSQGFHERAADVYRSLLQQRPHDERLAARLRESEQAAAAIPAKSEDDAGEVWLRGAGMAWAGVQDLNAADATPYAWTAAPDEPVVGEPIGSYLRDLVSWKAGQSRWAEAQSVAPPETDYAPSPEAEPVSTPEWLGAPPEQAPPPPPVDLWAEAVDEMAGWGTELPAEPFADETPADPWLQGTTDEPLQPPPASVQPAAAEHGEVEGWTPFGLEAEAAQTEAVPANTPPRAPAREQPQEDASEDEDLEMFRSWLQSLKK